MLIISEITKKILQIIIFLGNRLYFNNFLTIHVKPLLYNGSEHFPYLKIPY